MLLTQFVAKDRFIVAADLALRTVFGAARAARPVPGGAPGGVAHEMSVDQIRHSAGLMRVNHVGEVCAQALYSAQSTFAKNADTRQALTAAAHEEMDHLAWTHERLRELGARPSLLNPLWYAGAFALGAVAARVGDGVSLGFVVETEKQVEAHLASHLAELPEHDARSRAIVAAMKVDEAAHGAHAASLGAVPLPAPVQAAMQFMSKVMTTTAYRI